MSMDRKPKYYIECISCGKPAVLMYEDMTNGQPIYMENFVFSNGQKPTKFQPALCQNCKCPIVFNHGNKRVIVESEGKKH